MLVEDTGSSPRECASLIDLTIWVQSDFTVAERRGIDRDIALRVNGDPEQTIDFWHEWMNMSWPTSPASGPGSGPAWWLTEPHRMTWPRSNGRPQPAPTPEAARPP